MAILKMATAKTGDLSMFDNIVHAPPDKGYIEVSSDYYRKANIGTTGFSYKYVVNGSKVSLAYISMMPATYTSYLRFAVYIPDTNTNESPFYVELNSNSGYTDARLTISALSGDVTLSVAKTGSLSSLGTINISRNSWHVIEVYVYSHMTSGRATLRIDGVDTALDWSGRVMSDPSSLGDTSFKFNGIANGTMTIYFDDIMVRDDTWCGVGTLEVQSVNGNVVGEQGWTPSSGNAWECVNEFTEDWSDYITTPVASSGSRSLFTLTPLPFEPTAITAVGVFGSVKKDLPGLATAKLATKSGAAAINYGPIVAVSEGPARIRTFMATNPDGGGAWNRAAVEALKIGIENG